MERRLDGITQIEVNSRRGLNFPEAIRAMLRMDPDFLLVGEIRDPASAQVAVTAAATGLAVLSTLHARDAVGAVVALRNQGLRNWEIGDALELCMAQRLVRRLCLECRINAAPDDAEGAWFQAAGRVPPSLLLWHPVGCDACAGTGFNGRIGLFELWHLDEIARQLILDGADGAALEKHAWNQDMVTLADDAMTKVTAGVISLSEVRAMGGINRPAAARKEG